MLTIGPKNLAQARPTDMVGSGLAREFRAGGAGLPMARYTLDHLAMTMDTSVN
jgi:hypothetical protein